MLIGSTVLIGFAVAVMIIGFTSAVVELLLRNYHLSAIGSLAAIAATPLLLIGQNLLALATPLATN